MAIKTTYPYEMSTDIARHQCEECGGWERSDKSGGEIKHSKRCESRPQPESAVVVVAERDRREVRADLERFARRVRRTGMTGDDARVRECVQLGLLSESDAMNTDD